MLVVVTEAVEQIFILLEYGIAIDDIVKVRKLRNVLFDYGIGLCSGTHLAHESADTGSRFGILRIRA